MAVTLGPQAQDLYERITDLLGSHDVHPDDQVTIRNAWGGLVDGHPDAATVDAGFDDLAPEAQELIERLEGSLPRTSWDDPFDVPDDTSHMDN